MKKYLNILLASLGSLYIIASVVVVVIKNNEIKDQEIRILQLENDLLKEKTDRQVIEMSAKQQAFEYSENYAQYKIEVSKRDSLIGLMQAEIIKSQKQKSRNYEDYYGRTGAIADLDSSNKRIRWSENTSLIDSLWVEYESVQADRKGIQ